MLTAPARPPVTDFESALPPTPTPPYERLRDFIARRMRMGHVDQPLMLMELLGH